MSLYNEYELQNKKGRYGTLKPLAADPNIHVEESEIRSIMKKCFNFRTVSNLPDLLLDLHTNSHSYGLLQLLRIEYLAIYTPLLRIVIEMGKETFCVSDSFSTFSLKFFASYGISIGFSRPV